VQSFDAQRVWQGDLEPEPQLSAEDLLPPPVTATPATFDRVVDVTRAGVVLSRHALEDGRAALTTTAYGQVMHRIGLGGYGALTATSTERPALADMTASSTG